LHIRAPDPTQPHRLMRNLVTGTPKDLVMS
jgi:hypothetical protein